MLRNVKFIDAKQYKTNGKEVKRTVLICSILFMLGILVHNFFLLLSILFLSYSFIRHSDIENYYIGLFLIPCIRIFDSLGATYYVNIVLAIPLILLVIRRHGKLPLIPTAFTLLLTIWEIIHPVIEGNTENIPSEISTFAGMLFCLCLLWDAKDPIDIKQAFEMLSIGIISSTLIYLINNPYMMTRIIRNGRRLVAYASDPNYFSLYICLCLSIIFILNKYDIRTYISLIALIGIGLMTSSKMCLILMLFILVFGFYNSMKGAGENNKRNFVIFGILILIVAGGVFSKQLIALLSNILNRMNYSLESISLTSLDIDTLTSNRSNILEGYLDVLKNDIVTLLFGRGFQYYRFLGVRNGMAAHNTFFDLVLAWGLLGTVFVVPLIIKTIKKYRMDMQEKYQTQRTILPFVVLMINFLDLSCFNATMFWWVLSLGIFSLSCPVEQ